MRRERQDFDEIIGRLSSVETDWQDEFSAVVVSLIGQFPEKSSYTDSHVIQFLRDAADKKQFDHALTVVRLVLGLSKDEFTGEFKRVCDQGAGRSNFTKDPARFVACLRELGLMESLASIVNAPVTWRTLLVERLRGGRGSAIKGQRRGRGFEDLVESIVRRVFGTNGYDVRCRFVGESGQSTEKADFVIPNKDDAQILIEAKAYGATGSKQSDVLGDISRIVEQKRHDAYFLVVTDGLTWRYRANDLRKILELQNRGRIMRIYTSAMADELEADLRTLKQELEL